MRVRWHSLLTLCAAPLVAACGGDVVATNGGAGGGATTTTTGTVTDTTTTTTTGTVTDTTTSTTGTTTTGTTTTTTSTTSTTSTTTVPDACAVPADGPGPYAVTFRVENDTAQSLFLRDVCYVDVAVSACADGYAAPLAIHADCMMACEGAGPGCIECGACMETTQEIPPGGSYDVAWSGVTYTFGQTADHCPCYVPADAPAAKYRAAMQVYLHPEDALARVGGIPLSADFALPAPAGVVVLPVGLK